MKKLAIIAAAAVGFAIAERMGRKKDVGFPSPEPVQHEYPAPSVVPDLPTESVSDESPAVADAFVIDTVSDAVDDYTDDAEPVEVEPVVDTADDAEPLDGEPVEETSTVSAAVINEAPIFAEADTSARQAEDYVSEDVVSETDLTEAELTEAEAEAAFEAEFEAELAAEAEAALAAELAAQAVVAPPIEPFLKHPTTDENITEVQADEVDETQIDSVDEHEEEIESPSAESLETWESNWGNDMPFVDSSSEPASDEGESAPATKLSDIAENIVAKVQTAADLVREDDVPPVESDDAISSIEPAEKMIDTPAAFVIPTADDYADEVFEGESADSDAADPVAFDERALAETGLIEAIADEELGKES